jgi:hypothetical protein
MIIPSIIFFLNNKMISIINNLKFSLIFLNKNDLEHCKK